MSYRDFTVIIPTLNEAKNISELIGMIGNSYDGIKIVVADDGSSDGTKEIVMKLGKSNRNVKLLDRSRERIHGITASVIDAAKSAGTPYIIVIDGDLQHPPEKIGKIAERLREGNDIAIGTRQLVIGSWPLHRRLMSLIATNLARARLLRNIKDPMSGFFGARNGLFMKAAAENEERFVKEGYKVLFDLLKCAPKAKIAEVPYNFGERKRGKSKIKARHVIYFLKSLLR